MNYQELIERRPEIMMGKPIIKGTRITVEHVMRKLAGGYTVEGLLKSYPHLTHDQIKAALEFTADMLANEEIIESV